MVLISIKKVIRVIRKVLFTITLLVLIAAIIGVLYFGYKFAPIFQQYVNEADELVRDSSASTFYTDNTSFVYASDGTEIAKLRSGADSSYVTYEQMPKNVLKAFVAIEDKRFYKHHGVDWGSTIKSAFLLLKNGSITRGGSTITQQLVRNVFTDKIGFEKSYTRKIKEILTAMYLEKKYSKKQILEYYINNINYANNYYGIGAASLGYFGKSVDELTDAEVALLCAIPNNPTYYNPRTNLAHTIKRRNIILREMYDQGYLKRKDYLAAVNSSVSVLPAYDSFYNYESSYAIKCATEALMKNSGFVFQYAFDTQDDYDQYQHDYSDAYKDAEHMLYTGGYQVYTTIDLKVQKQVQKSLDNQLKDYAKKTKDGVYVMQGAATVIANHTGKVIACVGGRSQDSTGYSLNRAFQSYMQPGSTIKPLIVYTPALQKGYTPNSIVSDTPIKDGPKNSGNQYEGDITMRRAVEKSKNVVAWRLFSKIKPKVGLSYVQNMQFDKITPNDYFKPAALGGLYYGVTTVQMASGYATLANDGVFRQPDCISAIFDQEGNEIFKSPKSTCVYSSDAANQMLDILTGVANTGTAAGLVLPHNKKMPIACKTGTTNEQRCAWFCGVTPYYSVAVYVGRDDNKSTDGLWGSTLPKYVWQDVQDYLCKGKDVKKLYKKVKVKKQKSKKATVADTESDSTTPSLDLPNSDLQNNSTNSSQSSSQKVTQDSKDNSKKDTKEDTKPSKKNDSSDIKIEVDTEKSDSNKKPNKKPESSDTPDKEPEVPDDPDSIPDDTENVTDEIPDTELLEAPIVE